MSSTYKKMAIKERAELARISNQLSKASPARLPPMILMTDPTIHYDVRQSALAMPDETTIIYRHFGAREKLEVAHILRQITFKKNQKLLIGHDADLAIECGADGVHFKRDANLILPMLWRQRCQNWIITMAGLKDKHVYKGDLSVLDGLFISSVFPSQSRSAGHAIGVEAFQKRVATMMVPVIALGGINARTAPSLLQTGAAGLAGRFKL